MVAAPLASVAEPSLEGGDVPTLSSTTEPADVVGVTPTVAEALVELWAATALIVTPMPPATGTQLVAAGSAGAVLVAATAGHEVDGADITNGLDASPV